MFDTLLRKVYKKSYYIVNFVAFAYLGAYGVINLLLDEAIVLPIGYTYVFWLVLGLFLGYSFAFKAITFLNNTPFDKPPK